MVELSNKIRIFIIGIVLLAGCISAGIRRVDQDGGATYESIQAALVGIPSGDTLLFVGSDIDVYSESINSEISTGNITFLGADTNPDHFPVLSLNGGGWNNFWNNKSNCSTRFERVVLSNCLPIKVGYNNNKHKCIIEKSIVSNYSSNRVFTVYGDGDSTHLFVNNTIFINNDTIFSDISNYNKAGPYGLINNCTFDNNTIVNADVGSITGLRMVQILNSIFYRNTTITNNATIKNAYHYCLIPTAESTDWPGDCIKSNDPKFFSTDPSSASDFRILKASPARDKGNIATASDYDIIGRSRDAYPDIGAWEWVDTNVAPTGINLPKKSINEGSAVGSLVGILSSIDDNSGDVHTYSFVSGDIFDFSLFKDSLFTTKAFNYEVDSTYSIRIRTTDKEGLYFDSTFEIKVIDVNENIISVNLSNNYIAENTSSGKLIGKLTSTDPDLYETYTYTLSADDIAKYTIKSDSLLTKSPLNYELDSLDTITVSSSDNRGSTRNQDFVIHITNINERPSSITLTKDTVSENTLKNTLIGKFSTVDPDKNNNFVYSFSSGVNDNANFTLDGTDLLTNTPLDYETKHIYTIHVKSNDGANSITDTFKIYVANRNDPPQLIILSDSTIGDTLPAETIVGSFSTIDQDTGDIFTYELTGTGDDEYFTIDGTLLRTASVLSYKDKPSYSIRVRATDSGDKFIENSFNITILSQPHIMTEPANVVAGEGKSASFTVSVTGTTPFSYSWYNDSDPSEKIGSSSTLTFNNLLMSQNNSSYYCIISNSIGNTKSRSCSLTVLKKPGITKDLKDTVTVTESHPCTLSIVASGDSLSYLWIKNGNDTLDYTSSQLIIDAVSGADSGNYKCIISNIAGIEESEAAFLRVLIPPKFISVPDSVVVLDGDTAKFNITVIGTTPLSYEWIKNGTISAGSSAQLVIPVATLADNGSFYYCKVTNLVKTDSTGMIYLAVNPAPPVIDSQPTSDTVIENQSAIFKIKAHGTADLRYAWYSISDTNTVLSDSSILIIDSVTMSQSGSQYFCKVTNVAGIVLSNNVSMLVCPERPLIFKNPEPQIINAAKKAKFTVAATGTPVLNYAWYKTEIDSVFSRTDSLVFDPVKKSDDGRYYCVITNGAGSDTSDTVRLIVDDELKAPEIITQPLSQTKYIGESVTFSVVAQGYPAPKYQWILNNTALPKDTGSVLTISSLTFSNNYDSVICMVYNSQDTIFSKSAVLTITPAPVADFTATPTGGTSPLNVLFTNNSSGIYSNSIWNFGDGITSTEPSPQHSYTKIGLYDVKLIINGIAGSDTIIKTKLVYVYNKGENPVQITAKYLRRSDVEITLTGLDKIEPDIFPPIYDSIGIWISKDSLPANPIASTRIKKYSKSDLANKSEFKDTLSFSETGITWYLMNGLYLSSNKISVFNPGNGTEVLLKDTTPPQNVLTISGRHLGGDSALISIGKSSEIDTEKVDSVVYCYALDSTSLDYDGQSAKWFSVQEFSTSIFVDKKIFSDIFSMGSHQMWCGVKLKGKNNLLSTPRTAKFLTTNSTVDNPIHLYAQTVNSSVIRLSWDEINSGDISRIRIWYGTKEVPVGSTLSHFDFNSIEVAPTQNSYIVELLNSSTMYYFGAQVNKSGIWSDINENSKASAQTDSPSSLPPVTNTITLHSPRYDTASAKIKLSWCLDTVGIGDSLELAITYSNDAFENVMTGNVQILSVKDLCDSTILKLPKIIFNSTYYISMWLRKTGCQWALPVELSRKSITTPDFIREPVTYFEPTVLFDTVRAFNGTIILSKDSNYGTQDTTNDTIIYYGGNSYKGMIPVGNGFYFANKSPAPAFWIGLKYSVPAGFKAGSIVIYRETSKGLFAEYETINDTVNKIISVRTNKFEHPFILLIDTMPPILKFQSNTEKIVHVGKSTSDTVNIQDNIINAKYQYSYSTGKDPVSLRLDDFLTSGTQTLILNIPKEFSSVETGIRAKLLVTDGNNKINTDLSKQVYIEKVEMRVLPKQWTPVSVSSELKTADPESLIIHLSEVDSNSYDNRYARVFYWYPTSSNNNKKDDRWIEYNDSTKSYFNFLPGKTFWVKTVNEKNINMGPGLTMSLKDTAKIVLPKKEFTDLTLPYNFAIRINDILASSGMDSIGIYRWTNDSGVYITTGVYLPGRANKENRNDSLNWKYRNAHYSIYNLYNKDITLKIPPTPVSMSSPSPLKKQNGKTAWGVTVSCSADNNHFSEVFCGYSTGIRQLCYPVSPGFSKSRVKLFNRAERRFFGDYISGLSNNLTQEIAFENNEPYPVDFAFRLINEGEFPSNLGSSILNTQKGEWEKSGTVTVAANSIEYRWVVIADNNFMDKFKNTALSWKYALSSVYASTIRNAAVIKFTVPTGSKERVRFTIFDAMGRIIWEKTITHPLSSGVHTLIWNGENKTRGRVSTGMYFLKFSVLDPNGKIIKTFNSRLTYVH